MVEKNPSFDAKIPFCWTNSYYNSIIFHLIPMIFCWFQHVSTCFNYLDIGQYFPNTGNDPHRIEELSGFEAAGEAEIKNAASGWHQVARLPLFQVEFEHHRFFKCLLCSNLMCVAKCSQLLWGEYVWIFFWTWIILFDWYLLQCT